MRDFKLLIVLVPALAGSAWGAGWANLFDGKTLNGWAVHSGKATYKAGNGMIVGTAVLGSPNSFLCTQKEYGDFILEFEVKDDVPLNSGVQFRSLIAGENTVVRSAQKGRPAERKLPVDRVYGYQVEIPDAGLPNAGRIYDEARRGVFLDDVKTGPGAKDPFKSGQWNKYRVECRGDSIKTWVNGVPRADIKDSMTARGIIGLQVHQVPKDRFKPYQVRFRKIRIKEL